MVLQCRKVVSRVQLKAKRRGSVPKEYPFSVGLTRQPRGGLVCVVSGRLRGENVISVGYKRLGNGPPEPRGTTEV